MKEGKDSYLMKGKTEKNRGKAVGIARNRIRHWEAHSEILYKCTQK